MDKAQLLREVGAGYREVADLLTRLSGMMPTDGGQDTLSVEYAGRFEQLGKSRPLVRQAREAERRALTALSRYLGRPDLPPAAEDLLRDRERGRKLLVWRASFSKGVYDLVLREGELQQRRLAGKEVEGAAWEIGQPLPKEKGWQVVVEGVKGYGTYQVVQQPAKANHWTTIVRVDDEWTRRNNQTEIAVWALPSAAR